MTSIAENLERVRSQIAEAAKKSGRALDDIELVAISKTHEAEKVRAAFDAGQEIFGESRVQEARAKIPLLPSAARWHFVGRLQKNKIRHALPLFELFHSVDSIELAREMNRIASEEGLHPRVLLEVNVAGEGSKIGFAPDSLRAAMEGLLELPRLSIEGLMTIPPLAPEAEASRKYFSGLRDLRDQFVAQFQIGLPQLSMGMSDDFPVAIEEGATLVRVGTGDIRPANAAETRIGGSAPNAFGGDVNLAPKAHLFCHRATERSIHLRPIDLLSAQTTLVPMRLAPTNIQLIGGELAVQWNDSTESYFPLEYLRRACPCASCGGEPDVLGNVARPNVRYTQASFELVAWENIGGYALQPRWRDGHGTGLYSFQYLRRLAAAAAS